MFKLVQLFLVLFLFPTTGYTLTLPASHYSKGLVIPKEWQEKATYLKVLQSDPLPASFDWRVKLGAEVPVRDQGSCGSCWAFSRTTAIDWQILIQTGKMVFISPQELVSCDKEVYGCGGGYWTDYEVSGISDEADFPYTAKDVKCKTGLPRKTVITKWLMVGAKNRKPTVDELKQAIFQYGPISVTVAAGGSFPNGCGGGQTNHMVIIVGWTADGKWIMQNSWGEGWGEKGYYNIKYGCFNLAEAAAVPIMTLTPPKPVTFVVENTQVALAVTVQPGTTYGVEGAKKALKSAINSVEVPK